MKEKTLIFIQHMFDSVDESEAVLTQLEKEGWELHEQLVMYKSGIRLVMKRDITKILHE